MNLREYAERALEKGAKCWSCGGAVSVSDIRHYGHSDGWKVDGFEKRQWLYFECLRRRCRYQTSFAKLNIPRDSTTAQQC